MEKKKLKIIIGVVGVSILLIGAIIIAFSIFFRQEKEIVDSTGVNALDKQDILEVVAMTDSQEQAEEIAELYNIGLLGYKNGVARYFTTQTFEELKEIGETNDYPELYENNKVSVHTDM